MALSVRLTVEGGGSALPLRQPPRAGLRSARVLASGAAAGPDLSPAVVLCWDDFLPAQARDAVFVRVANAGREDFAPSRIYSADGASSQDEAHRKSLVVLDEPAIRALLMPRLEAPLEQARAFFGFAAVPLGRAELQVTASGDGDFFGTHCDDAVPDYFSRLVTFVYYLHRHPRPFSGGELRMFDSRRGEHGYVPADTWVDVEPCDNRLVMFPADRYHQVRRVECGSGEFADRRFTVNGWFWSRDDLRAMLAQGVR